MLKLRGFVFNSLIFIDRLHWLWLACAMPFLLFPSGVRVLAMLVVPGLWVLHWLVSSQKNARHTSIVEKGPLTLTPLNSSLLLMAVMVLVSTWATFDISFSLPKLSGMIFAFGVFFAVARQSSHEKGFLGALIVFICAGMGIAGLGLIGTQWFSTKLLFLNPIAKRIPFLLTGFQGAESGFHPNEVAGALTWVLPLLFTVTAGLFLAWFPHRTVFRNRFWGLLCFTVSLAGAVFTLGVFVLAQSRSGYIGFAVSMMVILLLSIPRQWRKGAVLVCVLGGILAGVIIVNRWEQITTWVTGSTFSGDPALSLNSLEGRVEVWSRAIYGLQDFPFTGMGMNTFRKVVHVLYPLFLVSPDVDLGHAHNEFLQVGLDLGIPGLIAFLAIYVGAFWMLFVSWKKPGNTPFIESIRKPLVLGFAGGLLAHGLYGVTDAVALGAKPGFLFWMLLGLIAGLYGLIQSPGDVHEEPLAIVIESIIPAAVEDAGVLTQQEDDSAAN